jgi:hypothetical protein
MKTWEGSIWWNFDFYMGEATEGEARLNSILEFSPYLKENTTLNYYKDQLVNAV